MCAKKVNQRGEHIYKVIAKVGEGEPELDGSRSKAYRSVTYRTSNLVKVFAFLKDTYPGFKWMNVINRKTKEQVGNFTIKNPPTKARI